MEFVLEIIFELILEGSMEACKCSKIPKYVRYPLIGILLLFFIAVIGLIMLAGILLLKENILAGILFLLIGLLLLVMGVIKSRKIYFTKRNKE